MAVPPQIEAHIQGPLDAHENEPEPAPTKARKPLGFYLAFAGLALAVFVFQVDATALGISIPTIAEELHGTSLEAFWASIAYSLCVIASQLQWAAFSTSFGRKIPLLISMVFFGAGSIAFALARDMATLIAGRALQGFGGGGIDVLAEIILADITTLEERSLWLGLMGIPIAVGNIMGPIISALFTSYVTWRWLGWLNLPVLGVSLPLIIVFLRTKAVDPDVPKRTKLQRMDWVGMTVSVVGILALVLPVSWAGSLYPISSWRSILPLVLGIVILAVFLWYESRPEYPIVPLRLFTNRTASMTLGGAFVHGVLLSAILQYIPLLFQSVELQSVIDSAVSMLPASIVSVVAAVGAMGLVSLAGGGYAWVIRGSWVVLTVGTGILALINIGSTRSEIQGYPILWGTGVALLRLLILPMQASVKNVDDTGLATSLLLFVRFLGSLVGLAIASSTFNSVFSRNLSSISEDLHGPLAQLENSNQAIAFIPQLKLLQNQVSPDLLTAVLRVYLEGFRTVFYVMTGIAVLGFITSLFTRELSLKNRESSAQAFEEK
ncbi:major facilitator superfamily domain-containing protein [Hypoxylon sp. FL0543]|nr:major facilitator superfamily domain-containing protein [Hypoxylon sp. FL0543]